MEANEVATVALE